MTIIVIAHRLSTVRNADKIIVMKNGEVVEIGDHHSLKQKKGFYFELVQKQLMEQFNHCEHNNATSGMGAMKQEARRMEEKDDESPTKDTF